MGKKKVGGDPGITAGGDVNIGDITSSQVAIGKNITQTLTLSTTDKEELLKNLKEFQKPGRAPRHKRIHKPVCWSRDSSCHSRWSHLSVARDS